jgi:HK97 family phage major capsid protein
MDRKDLNELRTISDLEGYLGELKAEITRMNQEHAGLPFTEEQRSEFATMVEDTDAVEARIAELRKREEIIARLAGEERHREDAAPEWRGATRVKTSPYDLSELRVNLLDPEAGARALRDHAMRAIEQEPFYGLPDPDKARSNIATLLSRQAGADYDATAIARRILTTGSPEYHRGFWKAACGLQLTPEERTALATGSVGTGGAAVPFALDATVTLVSDGAINPFRQIARVVQITSNEWRGITTEGVTASYGTEASEASDNAPTLVQPAIIPVQAKAFIPFSFEIGQDWPALQAEMTRLFADAKDVLEADKFVTGTGTNEPEGIVAGLDTPDDSSSVVDTASIGAFAVADLYTVKNALPPRFRSRALWLGNGAIYDLVRQFDDQGGADLWVQLQFDRPANLIGRPAYEASAMDSAVAANNQILVYGDFSHYVIVDRIGMSVELVPHLFGAGNRYPTGQRGLLAFWRNSAEITSENAFRLLEVKAS